MDIGGFLGNIFHNIGSFFGGGNNQPQQPQPNPAQQHNPVPLPNPMALPQPVHQQPQAQAPQPVQAPVVAPIQQTLPAPFQLQKAPVAPQAAPTPQPATAGQPVPVPQFGAISAHPITPSPIAIGPVTHPDFSAAGLQKAMQDQRQHDAVAAAAPVAPNPVLNRLGNAANNSVNDTLNLVNSNPVSSAVASIPQNLIKAGIQTINQFGGNVATNIQDPTIKAALNQPNGNVGNLTTGGNDAAKSIDSFTGDGKGPGLSSLPAPAKTALGAIDAGVNMIPGIGLIKGAPGALIKAGSSVAGEISDAVKGSEDAAAAAKAATEVAPGVHGVNPDPTPVAPPEPVPVPGEPVVSPSDAHTSSQPAPVVTPPEQSPAPLETAPATPPVKAPVAATPETPALSTPAEPAAEAPAQTVETQTNPSSLNSPSDNNVPQGSTNVNPNAKTAPNAPDYMAKINKEIEANNEGNEHEVMDKQQMATRAEQTAQSADLPAQIAQHASTVPAVNTPQDAMDASALLRRMYAEGKDTPGYEAARNNLMDAIAEYGSKSGQGTNVMADVTAGMPADVKAGVLSKTVTKMWGPDVENNAKAPSILKTTSGQSHVQGVIEENLNKGEALKNDVSDLEGQITKLGDDAKNIPEMHKLGAQLSTAEQALLQHNGEAAGFIAGLSPKGNIFERLANAARTSMLFGVGGRAKNVINVGGNTAYEQATALIQSQLGKVLNETILKNSPNKAIDSSLLNRGIVTGTKRGFTQAGKELSGKVLTDQTLSQTLKKSGTDAYGLVKSNRTEGIGANISNFTHGLVNAPKNVFGQGVKDAQIVRLARQEGMQLGKTGDELKAFTVMRSYVPTKEMATQGQDLMDQVSHTNHNWIADKVGSVIEGNSLKSPAARGIWGIVRNGILPFAKYPATFLYNTLADRNVIADAAHLAVSAKHGDVDGITKALARGTVDGTLMYTGYHLMNAGIITDKDGSGHSSGGMYFHVGNRYIPLGLLGVTAESLLSGAAINQATKAGGDILGGFTKVVADTLFNTVKTAGAQSFVGADNSALTTAQNALDGKGGTTPADGAAAFGGAVAGQAFPGVFSDANAVLNGGIPGIDGTHPLNPTGEASLTKVTKGASGGLTPTGSISNAKDVPASTLMSLANRVPFLSQSLPRNPGTTANDMIDRVTGGDHVGQAQQAATNAVTTAKSDLQTKIQSGVPVYTDAATKLAPGTKLPAGYNFNDVVEKQIEGNNYDNAVKGLQSKLDALNKENMPTTKTKPVEDQIKQLSVLKSQGLSADFRTTYAKTTLAEWRNMGDSSKSTYNPDQYKALFNYDQALAQAGVAGSSSNGNGIAAGSSTTPKFSAKTPSAGSAKAAANKAASLIKQNTVGSLPTLQRENFITMQGPKEITIPQRQVKLTPPGGLIKARNISVSLTK